MNDERYTSNEYEEISLRELIEVLLEGKRIIAITTVITLALSIIFSFFVLTPSYEATTVLLTSPVYSGEPSLEGVNNVIDTYNNYPEMTVETYLEQIKAPEVLQATIEDLQLKDGEGSLWSPQILSQKISVSNVKNTNLLKINVSHSDPEMAANIANSLGQNFIEFVSDNIRKRSLSTASLIEEQLKIEEENIATSTQKLTDYLAVSQNIDEMKKEMDSIINQITTYKSQINNIENSIIVGKETLDTLHKAGVIGVVDIESLEIDLSSNGNSDIVEMNINNSNDVEQAVISLKIANLETELVENISKKDVLTNKIEELQKDLVAIQTKIAEEEYKYNAIQRDLNLAKQAYNAYQQRHKEAIITAASDLGNSAVVISSAAIVPTNPVSPNKMLNLAIGVVLGLMIGVFITFFKHYWVTTNKKVQKEMKGSYTN